MGIASIKGIERVAIAALLAAQLVGCRTLKFWERDEKKGDDAPEAGLLGDDEAKGAASSVDKGTAQDEHELKLAKLWARVDELEEEQLRQKERVRVIEKGLTLGLVPEELKTKPEAAAPKVHEPKIEAKPEAKLDVKVEPKAEAPAAVIAPAMSKEEKDRYQTALASAHDHYRAGRYGRAIVEYSDIAKVFGEKVDGGMHLYWVARCWINLKEYNTARQQLVDFLKEYPGSAWAPRGKLELARVEWKLGLGETALQRFRDIIQQHPYEDAAEMAKMELQNLDKTL